LREKFLSTLKNVILYGKVNKEKFDSEVLKEFLLTKKEEIEKNNKEFDGVNDNELKQLDKCLTHL